MFSNFFFRISCRYAIVWKNNVDPERPQMRKWRMFIEYWIPKASNTPSEYVTLFFHSKNGCKIATHCYVIRKLFFLFHL
jgi:hypothetical protein